MTPRKLLAALILMATLTAAQAEGGYDTLAYKVLGDAQVVTSACTDTLPTRTLDQLQEQTISNSGTYWCGRVEDFITPSLFRTMVDTSILTARAITDAPWQQNSVMTMRVFANADLEDAYQVFLVTSGAYKGVVGMLRVPIP